MEPSIQISAIGKSSEDKRYLFLEAPALAPACGSTLLAFEGTQALSSPYSFFLTIRFESTGQSLDMFSLLLSQWLGKPIGFGFRHQPQARFHGIVLGVAEEDESTFRVSVGPRLSLLQRSTTYRSVANASVKDIVTRVLNEAGITDLRWNLENPDERIEACLQLEETDFAFVSRLVAERGWVYFFEHAAGRHTMVFTDQTPMLASGGVRRLKYERGIPIQGVEPSLLSWTREAVLVAGEVTASGFNPSQPRAPQTVSEAVSVHAATEQPRIWDLGLTHSPDRHQVKRLAAHRAEQVASERERITVTSTACLRPGDVFQPSHIHLQVLVKVSRHQAMEPGLRGRSGYVCVAECQPARLRFRPHVAPPPDRWGTYIGTISDAKGQVQQRMGETALDPMGRAYVRLRCCKDGEWGQAIPAVLANAATFASLTPPVIGQEVLVAFEHAAPDVAVIMGPRHTDPRLLPHDPVQQPPLHTFRVPAPPGKNGKDSREGETVVQVNPDANCPSVRASFPGSLLVNVARSIVAAVKKTVAVKTSESINVVSEKELVLTGEKITLDAGGSHVVISSGGVSVGGKMIYLNSSGGPSPSQASQPSV